MDTIQSESSAMTLSELESSEEAFENYSVATD
jgi:hypothetical protein